jgi:hydroxyethylthiazole kinase-like uncharacterized protein yjeF
MLDNAAPYINKLDLDLTTIKRKSTAHKGSHGSIAIIGGQDGMLGALLLASRSALLSGSGRVYACCLANNRMMVDQQYPEIMYRTFDTFKGLVGDMQALVIGPGLGQSKLAIEYLAFCLAQTIPLLIDADALNLIAGHTQLSALLTHREASTVITPHPGEASRLLDVSITEIQNHRFASALAIVHKYQCDCVLKGAESVCINKAGKAYINPTGNAGLATAGTGDVLSGLIGGFMAQGMSSFEALKLGTYIHGAAADNLVARGIGPIGLTASEVAIEARYILNKWGS